MWPFKKEDTRKIIDTTKFSCIAKQILKDLRTIPPQDWTQESDVHMFIVCHPDGKYTLSFRRDSYESDDYSMDSVKIVELNHNPFTEDEKRLIFNELKGLQKNLQLLREEKEKLQDSKFLETAFPDCFKKPTTSTRNRY
jgi:hypothetical protein